MCRLSWGLASLQRIRNRKLEPQVSMGPSPLVITMDRSMQRRPEERELPDLSGPFPLVPEKPLLGFKGPEGFPNSPCSLSQFDFKGED